MATSSPSPTSPLAASPASDAVSPPAPSTPTPASVASPVINANPPDPSTPAPPPSAVASPPPASPPPPLAEPPSPPPPESNSTPPAPVVSPPPPTAIPPPPPLAADAPPPSSPVPSLPTTPAVSQSPPPPTAAIPPLTSPPPPDAPSPPSVRTSSPPPPDKTPKSPPPSTLRPTHSSPPPPTSKPQPAVNQSPPPPVTRATHPRSPPSATQPPVSSPSPPSREPPSALPSQPTVSRLSPPPPVSPSPDSAIHSSAPITANPTANPPSKGVPMGGVVSIGVVLGFIMLGLIGMAVFCMCKRKRRTSIHNGGYIVPSAYGSSPGSDFNLIVKTQASSPFARSGSGSGGLTPHSHGGRSWFTYEELFEATGGFALENLLGEGGFGLVYKGVLDNGREVAVKHLKVGGSQGEREFQAEVETISRIHHRHLVSLVGYCMSECKRLLVYEYVPNQTLYYHLHGENRPVLDWATRIKIAEGAARGIAYLHEDCHPRIIHRDIKSSNILLDTRFEARVSDFGLAKLALDAESHVSTRVMGTFGYMAPEYATSGKLTDKSDVYSFGVVLLELITGRKPVDGSQPMGDESLVEWARPLLSHALHTGQVEGLVDPRLERSYVESELFLMVEAAAACVRHLATKRPRMGQVVRAFDGRSPSDLSNGMRFGQSEIYDSAQQSADIRWFRRMAFGSHEYSTDYFSEAIRNSESVNNQGPGFSTQQGRNDPSQSSQNPDPSIRQNPSS